MPDLRILDPDLDHANIAAYHAPKITHAVSASDEQINRSADGRRTSCRTRRPTRSSAPGLKWQDNTPVTSADCVARCCAERATEAGQHIARVSTCPRLTKKPSSRPARALTGWCSTPSQDPTPLCVMMKKDRGNDPTDNHAAHRIGPSVHRKSEYRPATGNLRENQTTCAQRAGERIGAANAVPRSRGREISPNRRRAAADAGEIRVLRGAADRHVAGAPAAPASRSRC